MQGDIKYTSPKREERKPKPTEYMTVGLANFRREHIINNVKLGENAEQVGNDVIVTMGNPKVGLIVYRILNCKL